MAEVTQIPEPPKSAIVIAGPDEAEEAYIRVDAAGLNDEPCRWWPLTGWEGVPITWQEVCAPLAVDDETGEERPRPRPVERLYRQSEVDELVAQAVADGGYEQIGDHRIALSSGHCVVHGEVYEVPHELDRLRQRLAEEGRDAD